ncbi:MAG: spore coat U domain-containing protein [Bacteroidota bacterium]
MKTLSKLLPILLILGTSNVTTAATDSGTLTVTATVAAACSIGDATLNFGAYDPSSATDTDAQTTVTVTCTNGSAYSIYSTTANADRKMITGAGGAGQELTFGVYGSAANRTSGTQLPVTNTSGKITGTGSGSAQNVDLYGRIAALQNVYAGSYTNAAATTNLTIEY